MKNDEDKKKKSIHPLDTWPPPQKKNDEEKKPSEKLPRNVSYKAMYKDSDPLTDESSDMAVYEVETQEEQEREQEQNEDLEKNRDDYSKQNDNNLKNR